MPTPPMPDELCKEAISAYERNNNNAAKAAKELGIPYNTFAHRLKIATCRGFSEYTSGHIPPGLEISGVSTLYGPEGEVRGQWVKTKADFNLEQTIDIIKEAFEEYKGSAILPNMARDVYPGLLTVYPLADLHFGMFAWKEETGEDYDLKIAERVLKDTMTQLVASSPLSETAIILNLGDFFHSDSNENRTRRSGNVLDTDTRYAKVLRTGVLLLIDTVHLALQKHKNVLVRCLQGNHDPYGALALTVALDAYFHGHERVSVDISPSPFFWHRHGKVLLGATHGDMAKPSAMAQIMAAKRAKDWGETEYRYIYMGHVHQRSMGGGELAGAIWETFQTLAPKDAWGNSMGFTSGRSMQSITHSKSKGEVSRLTVAIKGPE